MSDKFAHDDVQQIEVDDLFFEDCHAEAYRVTEKADDGVMAEKIGRVWLCHLPFIERNRNA